MRKTIDPDVDGLARAHKSKLGLLEVGDDVRRIEGHHSHQLRARRYKLSHAQGPRSHVPLYGRSNRRVGEIECGLLFHRKAALMLGLCLIALSRQDVDPPLRCDKSRLIAP